MTLAVVSLLSGWKRGPPPPIYRPSSRDFSAKNKMIQNSDDPRLGLVEGLKGPWLVNLGAVKDDRKSI